MAAVVAASHCAGSCSAWPGLSQRVAKAPEQPATTAPDALQRGPPSPPAVKVVRAGGIGRGRGQRLGRLRHALRQSGPGRAGSGAVAGRNHRRHGDARHAAGRATAAVARARGGHRPGRPLPTLVCLRRDGSVTPAITWKDARADAWASGAIDARQRRELYERTGMPIDGRYLGPMLQYHYPGHTDIAAVLSAKDYLCYALTGQRVTDPSTAAGYGSYDLTRSTSLPRRWACCGRCRRRCCRRLRPAHAAARSRDGRGRERPVGLNAGHPRSTVGAADSSWLSRARSPASRRASSASPWDQGHDPCWMRSHSGTWTRRHATLLTPHVQAGWYGREMDLLAARTSTANGSAPCFGWLKIEGQLRRAGRAGACGSRRPVLCAYLARDEQGALWDPTPARRDPRPDPCGAGSARTHTGLPGRTVFQYWHVAVDVCTSRTARAASS